jgi:hypothetical protein
MAHTTEMAHLYTKLSLHVDDTPLQHAIKAYNS